MGQTTVHCSRYPSQGIKISTSSTPLTSFSILNRSYTPSQMNLLVFVAAKVTLVTVGTYHSMALGQDGSLWGTGFNVAGQLGDGSKTSRSSFVQVLSSGVTAVAAGGLHSMALKQDGSVWTAGMNIRGQLGDGSTNPKQGFVQVIFGGATAIAAGGYHSMVLKQDGSVWATGDNTFGQLGDGSTIPKKNKTKPQKPSMAFRRGLSTHKEFPTPLKWTSPTPPKVRKKKKKSKKSNKPPASTAIMFSTPQSAP